MKHPLLQLLALLGGVLMAWGASEPKPLLTWDPKTGRLDARVQKSSLTQTLSRLARVTGWRVYCEPGTDTQVSTAFKGLTVGEALPRILGNLSFNLVPGTNGIPQLYIYRTQVQSATQAIAAGTESEPGVIGNELILALKPGSAVGVDELAAMLGGKVTGHNAALNAWRLTFPTDEAADAARKTLQGLEDLASVENNLRFVPPDEASQMAARQAPSINLKPKVVGDRERIIVGLIDTGVQSLGPEYDAFLLKSIQLGNGAPASGEVSHGTAMAETILRGVSQVNTQSDYSPVRILPVDVYGSNESTTSWDVALGINAALAGGATIINLSLGSNEQSPWLHTIISNASRDGAIFIGAAGNSPVTSPTFPAAYPEVLAVTAGNQRGELAPYANRGSFVDVMAPGSSLVRYGGQTFLVSGTSPAAAYVSGIAGALRGLPGNTPAAIRDKIQKQLGYRPGK